ncbi:MAG: CoA transferase [Syntrophales bacterium]|jgi:crotonobetainyl-CoA:carnitine CoA-transferase CaiB-like acyl-CoA transferase|nr:CoA transferase [Syntrophales bacterium]MDY0045349.1 CoA transferase [Syntrophales bacterium]
MTEDYFSFTDKIFDRSGNFEKPEALEGIRVLDLAHVIFGPVISKWLALYGAEVIKVEEPEEGDPWRTASYWAKYWKDSAPFFQSFNPNKYYVGVDLKKQKGKELILELAKKSDVVVENFRAGLVEAWGIGYTTVSKINPRVIYISCSGYGQWGPLRFFPSWDLIAQSMSGVARLTGFGGNETYKLPDYYGDFYPGLIGAISVLAALNHREKTGEGQFIDMTQTETLMRMMHNWFYMELAGEDLKNTGNVDPSMAPSGIFKTRDEKFVAIAIATDEQFMALMNAMDRKDLMTDTRFMESSMRLKEDNADRICAILEEWVHSKTESEIIESAKEKGFAAAPVMDDLRMFNDEWRRERGSLVHFEDDMYGKGTWPGTGVALQKTPERFKSLSRPVGYHNHYIFQTLLGLSKEELTKLEKDHVIGYWGNRVGQKPPDYYDMEKDPIFNFERGERR